MVDAAAEFTCQGFEAGGWDIAKRPAKELLAEGAVSFL
jgi:hypothetical protein